jgi:phage head maturation protease
MSNQSYAYQQPFTFLEVELKGEKKYFIEGFISTTDPDLSNEVLTLKAQEDIVKQCLNNSITMDVEHEEWYKEGRVQNKPSNTRIPVAKIVHAEIKGNGVWVKAEINQHSDRFKNIWGSVKEGFLHSFSVAFYPLAAVTKTVGNQVMRFIDSLSLVNVTLTGSPVNPNATFTPVMKAALLNMPAQGEIKMEETKIEAPVAAVKAEPVAEVIAAPVAEIKADFSADFATMKSEFEALKKAFESLKAEKDEKKEEGAENENKVPEAEEKSLGVHGGQNPHVKASEEVMASVKALQEEVASLKAEMAKPVIKGIGPETKVAELTKQAQIELKKSVLDYI